MAIIFFVYWILRYWSIDKTLYRNRIIIITMKDYIISKMLWGLLLDWHTIPWVLLAGEK